jgi:hypothetical protein
MVPPVSNIQIQPGEEVKVNVERLGFSVLRIVIKKISQIFIFKIINYETYIVISYVYLLSALNGISQEMVMGKRGIEGEVTNVKQPLTCVEIL